MEHHFAAYGFLKPSIGDYVSHQLMQRMDNPRSVELYRLVDPYFYRHRLTMPKFVLNAAGDQFFSPIRPGFTGMNFEVKNICGTCQTETMVSRTPMQWKV